MFENLLVSAVHVIKGTLDAPYGLGAHFGVALGGREIAVAEKFLDHPDVCARFEEVGREA